MNTTTKRLARNIFIVAVLIIVAVLCRSLTYEFEINQLFNKLMNNVRFFIYIGLFSAWGVSVSRRVTQSNIRRALTSVAALEVFWLTVREFKFHIVLDTNLLRFLWYVYYIPFLIIPLLALIVAITFDKPDDYRLPESRLLLYVPTAALILLMLTNDLHQFAFRFPDDVTVWNDFDYQYSWLFYVVTAWAVLCSLSAFILLLAKSYKTGSKRFAWLPLVPIVIALAYIVIYIMRIPFVLKHMGDIAVVYCLVFSAYFESCIQTGLIQSNRRYYELFAASVNNPVQIYDSDYRLRYASDSAVLLDRADIISAADGSVVTDNGLMINNMPIDGGFAVWTEDISDLLKARDALDDLQDELQERNSLLQYEYEKEKEYKAVEEKNRLYDLLQSCTQSRLDKIDYLVKRYKAAEDTATKKRILARIVIIGSYIKRRKDFVLSTDTVQQVHKSMLESAFAESIRSLRLLNIKSSYTVDTQEEFISSGILTLAYDFFETVIEEIADYTNYINISVCPVNSRMRISIVTDCEGFGDTSVLISAYPDMSIVDDDGLVFVLPLEGGDAV